LVSFDCGIQLDIKFTFFYQQLLF